LIGGEQAAEEPNRDLKVFDVNVAVEREIAHDEFLRLRHVGIEIHQNECVEGIDRGHQKRLPVPIVRSFT
jgi:hypothetical protein